MSIPTPHEAAAALTSLRPHPRLLRHSCAVADVAAWLGDRITGRGGAIDPAAVARAALLHDVDKALPPEHPARRLRHGEGSAAWLTDQGWPELAPLVTDHPVTRLAEDEAWERLQSAPFGARVVAYADKRAGQHLESMDERFASWRRRYPAGPGEDGSAEGWDAATARIVRDRADELEREVCAAAGTTPEEVGRLRWAAAAIERVR